MIPIFLTLIIYAVDFGYLFLEATNLSAAARTAVEYAIQGGASPAQAAEPSAAAVAGVAIASSGLSATSPVSVRVCSAAVGVNASTNTAQCSTTNTGAGAITSAVDVDPESTTFQLNRVDVVYTITPPLPLPASVFPVASLTFHRMVEMREVQ